MLSLILLLYAVSLALYLWHHLTKEFQRAGVKHLPTVPLFGNMARFALKQQPFADHMAEIYFTFPEEKFVGRFEFTNKVIFIRDLDLVKKIAITDFECFGDHRDIIDEKNDPLFGRNLLALKGQEWRDMRSSLSPAFTSAKIRLMVPFMVEIADQMISALKRDLEASEAGYIDVDTKDLLTRFAADVVASCAFGLKVDSHRDRHNEFYKYGKEASSFSFKQFVGFFTFPKLFNMLGYNVFSKESQRFFKFLVSSTIEEREKKQIVRHDMVHLLMEAKKGNLSRDDKSSGKDPDAGFAAISDSSISNVQGNVMTDWTENDLVAQAMLFFIAGFESVSSAMCFLLHELALNPDVQERLLQEIRENEARSGGKLDYSTIQRLVYMDMVVSEVLRKWPSGVIVDRVCVKDYNLGKPNSKSKSDYIVRKGTIVSIPVWGFHRDPRYFPDPENFDPERFSEQNRHKIVPFSFMPFSLGPRHCIGSRFALYEIKVMAYKMLQSMQVSTCPKTCVPTKLSTELYTFLISTQGGHWQRMQLRE